jgi:hypothetical protein
MKRVLITLSLLLSILVLPYWLYVPAIALTSIYIPYYIEAVILAFLIDVLYGGSTHTTITFAFPFAIGFSLLLIILVPLRSRLRIHA